MTQHILKLILSSCMVSLALATLSDFDDNESSGPLVIYGDDINLMQTAVDLHVTRAKKKLKGSIVNYFDNIPVYGYNRVHKGSHHRRDNWMVVFPQNYTHNMMVSACKRLPNPATCDHVSHPEQGSLAVVVVNAFETELRRSRMYTLTVPGALYIELDGLMHILNFPASQAMVPWGLDRIDSTNLDGQYTIENGGKNIHVYHMDTGNKGSLIDFGGRVISEWDATKPNPSDGCTKNAPAQCSKRTMACRVNCAIDRSGHGTHTAGTILATNYGVAQLAICHSMKVLSDEGAGSWSWLVRALDYVTSKGLKPAIVSASLGGEGKVMSVKSAIDQTTANNVVVVVAAGNDNSDACEFTPAFVPSAITVGSSDQEDKRSGFSNFGPCVDIFAPGSKIPSLSLQQGEIAIGSGTSMACPHVAGVIAIELERNHQLDASSAARRVISNAETGALKGMNQPGTRNKLLRISQTFAWEGKVVKPSVPRMFFPSHARKPVAPPISAPPVYYPQT